MSEMIERVARAIADNPVNYLDYVDRACAAIEAMREPTEAMSFDGFRSNRWVNKNKIPVARVSISPEPAWRAMIDAALSEHLEG